MHIKVKVFPGSGEQVVRQIASDRFEVFVREEPREGKANHAVQRALSSFLKIEEKRVRLIRGGKTRNKIFKII